MDVGADRRITLLHLVSDGDELGSVGLTDLTGLLKGGDHRLDHSVALQRIQTHGKWGL